MRHWLTRADPTLDQTTIKRFEPSHWTVDFPRGAMASVVSTPGTNEILVTATFGRKSDLVGLIFTSDDGGVHIGHRRHEDRDYSHCTLSFRWRSSGLIPLDGVNGPTLTIEGRDEAGQARSWFVRLWNYASGAPQDAVITLPFDRLDAGFALPADAERVPVVDIDRMFVSLVPPGFVAGSGAAFAQPLDAEVRLSDIECTGSGSTVAINDTMVPEHGFRICTAYDDCYQLTPERVIDGIERLGYRKLISHYVGMSHYPALVGSGEVDAGKPLNLPARRWHENFAAIAAARGYDLIWSLSFELLDQFCPDSWKQRSWGGAPARTLYDPPSTLLSPSVPAAIDYLGKVASAFLGIGNGAGLEPKLQLGEPWWWVDPNDGLCLYDAASQAVWPAHAPITDVTASLTTEQQGVLDQAGARLSSATMAVLAAARTVAPNLVSHLLVFLPSVLRDDAPDLIRANLPTGWAAPAFDVLQLEDYDWVTEGRVHWRRLAEDGALARLGYPKSAAHYLSGFVPSAGRRELWQEIISAANDAAARGFEEVLIWALPQVFRDNLTIYDGGAVMDGFRDVDFPLGCSSRASVEPGFSNTIFASVGGFEYRNANWDQARLRFDVGPGIRSLEDLKTLLHFFRSMRGSATAFRFRDPTDHSSAGMTETPGAGDALIGIGDGERRVFPLSKRYGDGEERRITRPVADTVLVSVDDVPQTAWALLERGRVEFTDPPAVGAEVRAGFLFDVPVRFEEDRLKVSQATYLAGEAPSVTLIEVREA